MNISIWERRAMKNWVSYVMAYQEYIWLVILSGIVLLAADYLLMKKFRFQVPWGGLYYFFYGLSGRALVSLAAGISRFLLVTALVLSSRELRMSHIVCLVVLSAVWQMDGPVQRIRLQKFLMDLIHMVGTCAGLLVCRTLYRYMADVRFAWDIQVTGILLGIFIIVYHLVLLVGRLPDFEKYSREDRERKKQRRRFPKISIHGKERKNKEGEEEVA